MAAIQGSKIRNRRLLDIILEKMIQKAASESNESEDSSSDKFKGNVRFIDYDQEDPGPSVTAKRQDSESDSSNRNQIHEPISSGKDVNTNADIQKSKDSQDSGKSQQQSESQSKTTKSQLINFVSDNRNQRRRVRLKRLRDYENRKITVHQMIKNPFNFGKGNSNSNQWIYQLVQESIDEVKQQLQLEESMTNAQKSSMKSESNTIQKINLKRLIEAGEKWQARTQAPKAQQYESQFKQTLCGTLRFNPSKRVSSFEITNELSKMPWSLMFGGALARRRVYKNGGDSDMIKPNSDESQSVKTQQSESKSQLLYIHPPIHKEDAEFFLYSEDGNQNRDDDTYDMNQQQATVTARFKELLVHHDDKLKSSQAMTKLLAASDNDSETLKLNSMEQQTKVVQPIQLAVSSESSTKQSDSSNLINKQVYQRLSDKTQQIDDDDTNSKLKSTKSNDSNSLGANPGSGVEQKQDADKKLNKDNTINTDNDKSNSNLNSDSSKGSDSNSPSPGPTAPSKNKRKIMHSDSSSKIIAQSYQNLYREIMWVFRFIIIITCICIGIAHCTKLGRGGTEEEDEPVASPENIDEDEEEISADHFSESVEEIKEGEGLIQDQNQSRM